MGTTSQLPLSRSEFDRLEIFRQVSYESMAGYLMEKQLVLLEPGEVVIDPGDMRRHLLVLVTGALEVRLDSPQGHVLAQLEPGCCVGEMSVFDDEPPSAWVIALEPSRLLVLERDTALAMVYASHDFCLNLLHLLAQRVRSNNQLVMHDRNRLRVIEQQASVDSLTGLHNRRWMENMFVREVNRCHAGSMPLVALMIDIDHFKLCNDEYGHLVGDKVLARVAQSISLALRPSDMIARYGGEEFAVLLPATSMATAKVVAERLRVAVMSHSVKGAEPNSPISVTVSIGLAELQAGDTLPDLLGCADHALYKAKQGGRNRCAAHETA